MKLGKFAIFPLLFLIFSCSEETERISGFKNHGIDISHYQGKIKWDKICKQDINFIFIKATEGINHQDSLFCENWENITCNHIKQGAYHFYLPEVSPLLQAQNFIANTNFIKGNLFPVLDIESVPKDRDNLLKDLQIWLDLVEDHYGVAPIIYTNIKYYNNYLKNNFSDSPLWIARYNKEIPITLDDKNWKIWQYGNKGKLNGIDGYVDFNVAEGSLEEIVLKK